MYKFLRAMTLLLGVAVTFLGSYFYFGLLTASDRAAFTAGSILLLAIGPAALVALFFINKYRPRTLYLVLLIPCTVFIALASLSSLLTGWEG